MRRSPIATSLALFMIASPLLTAPAAAQGVRAIDLANMGREAYNAGDYKQAERLSKRAALISDNKRIRGFSYETICMSEDAKGDTEAALEACGKAVSYDHDRTKALTILASLKTE